MELMINKNTHTHTYVLEVTGIMMMLMAKSCHNDHESMVEGQDTGLRAERPAVQLLCLLLHILIHIAVQYHDNINLVFTCQAPYQGSY